MGEEEEQIPKGDDVLVDLEVTLKDLYLGHQFKACPCTPTFPHSYPCTKKPKTPSPFTASDYAVALLVTQIDDCMSLEASALSTVPLIAVIMLHRLQGKRVPMLQLAYTVRIYLARVLQHEMASPGQGKLRPFRDIAWYIQVTRDKPVAKPAPGKRKCNCRNKVVTRQLGPGMFQQFQQQECQECPNVKFEREADVLSVQVEPGMVDGQVRAQSRSGMRNGSGALNPKTACACSGNCCKNLQTVNISLSKLASVAFTLCASASGWPDGSNMITACLILCPQTGNCQRAELR